LKNNREFGPEIFTMLRRMHSIDLEKFIVSRLTSRELFEFIVGVVLSQNTNDENAIKAYENLKEACGGRITPKTILTLPDDLLVESIKIAGMYIQRARRVKELAKLFNDEKWVNRLINTIIHSNVEEARRTLMSLPGIGSKTADVILLMFFNKPTFPIDTHISRITRRLRYPHRYNYEDCRKFWMQIIKPEEYLEAHLLLIMHGRTTCKARKPECNQCLLVNLCQYGKKHKVNQKEGSSSTS